MRAAALLMASALASSTGCAAWDGLEDEWFEDDGDNGPSSGEFCSFFSTSITGSETTAVVSFRTCDAPTLDNQNMACGDEHVGTRAVPIVIDFDTPGSYVLCGGGTFGSAIIANETGEGVCPQVQGGTCFPRTLSCDTIDIAADGRSLVLYMVEPDISCEDVFITLERLESSAE